MTTTKKIQSALREVIADCKGGMINPVTAWHYSGIARKVSKKCGLPESHYDCEDTPISTGSLMRLITLAERYDVDASDLARVVAERKDRRQLETTFENRRGERLTIRADFRQAADSIRAKYNDGDWFGTPFQAADARHSAHQACVLVHRWVKRQS